MTGMRSYELGREVHAPRGRLHAVPETVVDVSDLPDVSRLLARLLDERIPLALIADLAHPDGPDTDRIMASEALDVG